MKNLFVPYPIAVIAKEKGFNEDCLRFFQEMEGGMYLSDDGGHNSIGMEITAPFYNFDGFPKYDTKIIAAPLYCQLVDWLREKHEIVVYFNTLHSIVQDGSHYFCVFDTNKEGEEAISDLIGGGDYYEALNKALEEAFKLI